MKGIKLGFSVSELSLHPRIILGIGSHWAWVFCVLFAARKITNPLAVPDGIVPSLSFSITLFVTICVAFFLMGLFELGLHSLEERKKCTISVTVLGFLGTLIVAAQAVIGLPDITLLSILAGFITGLASAYLMMNWVWACVHLQIVEVASSVACGFLLALSVYGIILFCNSSLVLFFVTLLAMLVEGIFCFQILKGFSSEEPLEAAVPSAAEITEHQPLDNVSNVGLTLKSLTRMENVALVPVLIIFGFIQSALRELSLSSFSLGLDVIDLVSDALVIGTGFATLFFVIYFILDKPDLERKTYSFSSLIVVAFAVSLLFFMDASQGLSYQFVCVVTYVVFETHIWVFFAKTLYEKGQRPSIVLGCGLGLLFLGQFLTPLNNGFITTLTQPLHLGYVAEPIFIMLALFVVVVILSIRNSKIIARSLQVEANDKVDSSATLLQEDASLCVEELIRRFELTEREGEVLGKIVQGKSISKISAQLYISQNTTKTHVKSIYKKTGVHSREQLLDLYESFEL